MRPPTILPFMLLIAVASISAAAVLIKAIDDAVPVVIAAARLGISALVLVPIAAIKGMGTEGKFEKRHVPRLIMAGSFLAAHFFFWITSLKYTSVVSSVVITTTNPIFVGIVSHFLFHERLTRAQVSGIALACLGGATIAWADSAHLTDSLYGDAMALGGAVMASCYFLTGRSVRKEVNTLSYILPVYGISGVLLVIAALAMGHAFTGYKPATYLYMVLLAVFPQLVGHSTFNWALRYMSATLIAVCILGEPIGAGVLAWLLLAEKITLMQAIGGALILAGICLTTRARPKSADAILKAGGDAEL